MTDPYARIAENYAHVRERVAQAARAAGRSPDDVTLVAVTKYVDLESVAALAAAGCRDFGESRPQAIWDRAPQVPGVRWHLIGHLQRNTVRRTLPLVSLIHSVDSPRLLAAIDEAANELGLSVPVLLEVNISGDQTKHGLAVEQVQPLLATLPQYARVRVEGLMAMASLEGGGDVARRNFADLRALRDRLLPECPPGVSLRELSMGMSGDYEIAIAEGATIVRVGSALFEGLAS